MFRVSQHPSSGILKTVPAASGAGHTACTTRNHEIKIRCVVFPVFINTRTSRPTEVLVYCNVLNSLNII